MRKLSLLFLTLCLSIVAMAQVVTTSPAFITQNYTGPIVVTFDPTQGNAGMAAATACYAHTGVITSASTSDTDWKCAPTWRGGESQYQMTRVGTKWQLTINDMYQYYSCAAGTTILKLAFVFNDGPGGSLEGKEADGKDILIPLYADGPQVKFDAPNSNQLLSSGAVVAFAATGSQSGAMDLKINGASVATATGTSLSYSHTFSTTGDFTCIVSSMVGAVTVYDTVMVCIAAAAASGTRPAGALEGINYTAANDSEVTLVMYAKDKNGVIADNVFVVGDFNNWTYTNSYQMTRDAANSGYYFITLSGLTPGQEYAFQYGVRIGTAVKQISDAYAEKVLDPWNDSYIPDYVYPDLMPYPNGKGDGLVSVLQTAKPTFEWSAETNNFIGPDKNNLVIYELWVHDFSPARHIRAVIDRLDYLQNLGINALELMPVIEFDGNISWGYSPNHFFAPDKAYGTEEAYKELIDECHKRGIAVILDMVFNHATGNNPWARLYWDAANNRVASNNPWFNTSAPHDASVFEDFNHDNTMVQDYFKRVLQHWLREYKVDGFRMDLTKGICGPNCNNRVAIINDYYNAVKVEKSDAYFILEHWEGSEEQGFVNNGMLCWGGGSSMNNTYSQTAMGWLHDGDDFRSANKTGWVYYAESHDEQRNFFKTKTYGNGNLQTDSLARMNRIPLNVAFSVMMKGPKMLWQFEEMGFDYTICYSSYNNDFGNEPGGSTPCYRTDSKPIPEALGWYSNAQRMRAYGRVAQMLQLRKNSASMFTNGTCNVVGGSGAAARYIQWTDGAEKMVVVGNFNVDGGTQYTGSTTVAPFHGTGTWYEYYSSATVNVANTSQTITLNPGELKIYTTTPKLLPSIPGSYDFPSGGAQTIVDAGFQCSVYPTMTDGNVYIDATEDAKNIKIYTMYGVMLRSMKHNSVVNVSDLPQGTYLMILTFDRHQEAFKVIRK